MKTDDLVSLLAADTLPVPRRAASRRITLALAFGVPLALLIMQMEYGVRRDLVQVMFWPMFWMKLLVPITIAVAGFVVLQRLARPGAKVGASWLGVAAPVLMLWAMAIASYLMAPEDRRSDMVWGQTWRTCVFSIAEIALPVFVAALVALRSLAPTRPAWAGACAGAMSGAAGAAVYALHCPELTAPFLAIWYVAGMALPAAVGAALGPRILRW
ncbi:MULTISPECIES: NrsF family protein [unclassified Variovorax]|uniref:NrsF family protein n=1 Tax=unclassified Variovorax TaxID=663243 RepID=UPI001BD44078|nr:MULTISPECIES: DUF1109 domain-containing protein [unclassified Variovorax]